MEDVETNSDMIMIQLNNRLPNKLEEMINTKFDMFSKLLAAQDAKLDHINSKIDKQIIKHESLAKKIEENDTSLQKMNTILDTSLQIQEQFMNKLKVHELNFVELHKKVNEMYSGIDSKMETGLQKLQDFAKMLDNHENRLNSLSVKLNEEFEKQKEVSTILSKEVQNKIGTLHQDLESKWNENKRQGYIEAINGKIDSMLGGLTALTNHVEKMEVSFARNIFLMQQIENEKDKEKDKEKERDRKEPVTSCYSNWGPPHGELSNHCYVSRSEIIGALKKFLTQKKDVNAINELDLKLKSLKIVAINKSTRFPTTGIYVNIKNEQITKYIQELYTCVARRESNGIRNNIHSVVAVLSKADTFQMYDIHNFITFEKKYDLRWSH